MAGNVSRNGSGTLSANAGSARFTTTGVATADVREYV
jgi:hypothetical protein